MADVVGSKIDSVAVDSANFDMNLITRDGDVLTTFVKLDSSTSITRFKLNTGTSHGANNDLLIYIEPDGGGEE